MTEQEVFVQAIQLQAGNARSAFLQNACGQDDELRRRVETLLGEHEAASDFMGEPAIFSPSGCMPVITEAPGTSVGPYRLLQRIGEGGFGVVYMAEQTEPVRRKVALKIIKPGMDTKDVIARFESERQALALMDHPNIARVLDAGATDSGRPYFVMELVKGVPITDFCDKNKLSVQDRLSLFVPVCLAVQHAHHKGVIHRDIKPSNVMVTLHDGQPVPKVIDFGVAKATSQQLTQRTLFTAYGQMIGTPVYMSPEQAEMSGLDIDTRSDIYSLGVLLYELLTGTTPIEQRQLRQAGLIEMQRLIRDVEAPKPSTRLSTQHGEASLICSNRSTDVRRLIDLLTGEVDWIVMKALEKDRQRRYDTPTAFAEDIQRYLKHEAIQARPASTAYRVRKFVQRNQGLAMSIGAVVTTLLLGVFSSTIFAVYANSQLQRALKADGELQVSLADARQAHEKAEFQRQLAETELHRAIIAEKAQRELTVLAEQQRLEVEQQKREADQLNTQLTLANEQQRRAIYANEMNLVRIHAQRGNLTRMREILMDQLPIDGREDLRGFEWSYWHNYIHQARVLHRVENFQYGSRDSAVSVVPYGELIAVTKERQTEIRRIASQEVIGTIPERLELLVNRTRFSSTGRSVHAVCRSMSSFWPESFQPLPLAEHCTVYEPTGDSCELTFPDQSFSHLSYLNISRDGRRIVVLGNAVEHQKDQPACRVIVWDVDSRTIVFNQIQNRELNLVEFSPDGNLLALYLCHGTRRLSDDVRDVAVVVDIATGAEMGVAQHNDDIEAVYWLPDQKRLLLSTLSYSGANRKDLLTWTINDQPRPHRLSQEPMPNYVRGVVSPDGKLLAVAGHTVSSIRLIDTESGEVVRTLQNEATTIDNLTFSRDGQQVLAASTNGEVLSWDLRQDTDLFALSAKPLPQLAYGGYALNEDQSLLAIVTAPGAVLIRNRAGDEIVIKLATARRGRGTSRLTFSSDNRFLVHQITAPASETSSGGSTLEMYDLRTGCRSWQMRSSANKSTGFVAFTPDNNALVVLTSDPAVEVFDSETGATIPWSGDQSHFAALMGTGKTSAGRPVVAYLKHDIFNADLPFGPPNPLNSVRFGAIDLVTGERIYETSQVSMSKDGRSIVGLGLIPSPDAQHLAKTQAGIKRVEIWNMVSEQLAFSVEGTGVVFSHDGSRVAVWRSVTFNQVGQSAPLTRISEISIWDVARRQQLSKISLAGNFAEVIRFSPDGLRLLTLHGKSPLGSGGSVAQGQLWDVQSGQEILTIPVADANVYNWDLVFDSSGNRLTSLMFGKASGTGGGGKSVVYDATPLDDQVDAQMIAQRLVEKLTQETPMPSEVVTAIQSNPRLSPLVREAALRQTSELSLDIDNLAMSCFALGLDSGRTAEDYLRGLKWARALKELEPDSIRTQAATGILQYRLQRTAEALEILKVTRAVDESVEANSPDYETLRRAALVLTLVAAGELSSAETAFVELMLTRSGPPSSSAEIRSEFRPFLFEAVIAWLGSSGGSLRNGNPVPAKTTMKMLFEKLDSNHDGLLVESEFAANNQRRFELFEYFDADGDSKANLPEFEKFLSIYRRYNDQLKLTPEERLAVLEKMIAEAPEFLEALNERAWIRSTAHAEALRDGQKAVIDATRANEATQWMNPNFVDTLAAAFAESGQFVEAIRYQEKALQLLGPSRINQEFSDRLAQYRQGRPYRIPDLPARSSNPGAAVNPLPRGNMPVVTRIDTPLLAAEHLARCRSISGRTCAWSPGGDQIVRSRNVKDDQSGDLEAIDLKTGATAILCSEGTLPDWSYDPDGPLAFTKDMSDGKSDGSQQELWLVKPDGSDLRKVGPGGCPSWTTDHRLFYRSIDKDQNVELLAISPANPDAPVDRYALGGLLYPRVSRDGTLVAAADSEHLTVRRLATNEVLLDLPLKAGDRGVPDFSPDGKYLVCGSSTDPFPGVWLIDVATGKKRLLADIDGASPRWSPDGTLIAIGRRDTNEILLLDISPFDLSQGIDQLQPLPVSITVIGNDRSASLIETRVP